MPMCDNRDEIAEKMKHKLCTMFHRQCSKVTNAAKKKLVLHFDLNKTVVPVDTATGETVEAALNVYLSGMAWGQDKEGVWHCSKDELSSAPDNDSDVSFYKFEEKRLLPSTSRDRSMLRYHLTSFTDRPQGTFVKPYLNALLDTLKWKQPYIESRHKHVTVPGTKSIRFHFILPAFYKLLNYLVTEERNFTVVFRSYGTDARNVLNSIKTAISCGLPFCQNLHCLSDSIQDDVWTLTRCREDGIYEFNSGSSNESETGKCLKTDNEIYSELSNMSGICAIRDDVGDWYAHNFDPAHGKPLWIDLSDTTTHHIFFDDNIRPGASDSIVNVRVRESPENFRSIDSIEEYKFVNTNMVPVTFPDAIMDEEYFVQKLLQCEENYAKFIDNM